MLLQPDVVVTTVTEKINSLLESFIGINDIDLGKQSMGFLDYA